MPLNQQKTNSLELKEFTCSKCGAKQKARLEKDESGIFAKHFGIDDTMIWDNKCFYCGEILDPLILPMALGLI